MAPAHLGLVLLIDLVWGLNAVISKVGVTLFPPLLFTGLRFVAVLALLFPYLRWKRGEMGAIFAVTILGGLLNFGLSFWGTALSNASLSSVLGQLNAPFATILSIIFLKEHVGWRRWLGIGLAFAGTAYLGFDPHVAAIWVGGVLVVAAALSMSAAQILMRRLRDVGVLELQAWIALVCAPGLLLASAFVEQGQVEAMRNAPWYEWSFVLYNAVGAGIIGQGGMYFLLRRYDIALVTSLFLIAPVFGVMFGVWLLDEPMTPQILIGSGLTLIGILIIALRQRRSSVTAVAPGQGAIEPAPAAAVPAVVADPTASR